MEPQEARAELERIRSRISEIDDRIIRLIGERKELVVEVGRLKAILSLPILDPGREAQVVRQAAAIAREVGVDEELARDVIWRIIASARSTQEELPGNSVPPPK